MSRRRIHWVCMHRRFFDAVDVREGKQGPNPAALYCTDYLDFAF